MDPSMYRNVFHKRRTHSSLSQLSTSSDGQTSTGWGQHWLHPGSWHTMSPLPDYFPNKKTWKVNNNIYSHAVHTVPFLAVLWPYLLKLCPPPNVLLKHQLCFVSFTPCISIPFTSPSLCITPHKIKLQRKKGKEKTKIVSHTVNSFIHIPLRASDHCKQ